MDLFEYWATPHKSLYLFREVFWKRTANEPLPECPPELGVVCTFVLFVFFLKVLSDIRRDRARRREKVKAAIEDEKRREREKKEAEKWLKKWVSDTGYYTKDWVMQALIKNNPSPLKEFLLKGGVPRIRHHAGVCGVDHEEPKINHHDVVDYLNEVLGDGSARRVRYIIMN